MVFIKNNTSFINIKLRRKKVEVRLYKGRFKEMYIGQHFIFCHDNEKILVKIIGITLFQSLGDMIMNTTIVHDSIPDIDTSADILSYYKQFYTDKHISQKKAMAIHFTLV